MKAEEHLLLLIGGPAASGKNTLIEMLCQHNKDIGYYRRNDAFFDCAKDKNIPKEQVYSKITPKEANERFVEECCKYNIMISDVHYAVQLKRDQAFAVGKKDILVEESYVPTISDELLTLLVENNIGVIAILLFADAEILMQRAVNREKITGKEIRACSLEDIDLELEAEKLYWNKLKGNPKVQCISYDTSKINCSKIISDLAELI